MGGCGQTHCVSWEGTISGVSHSPSEKWAEHWYLPHGDLGGVRQIIM